MGDNTYSIKFQMKGAKEGARDVDEVKEAVKDLTSALRNLGFKDVDSAFKQSPKLAQGIASGLGLEVQKVMTKSVAAGVKEGVKKGMEESEGDKGAAKFRQRSSLGSIPVLQTPEQQRREFTKNLLGGLAASAFNPYIGARLLNNARLNTSNGLGGQGGGGNGFFGAGGAFGFGEIYVAIEATKKVIQFAAKTIQEAFQRGSDLYIKAAQLRVSSGDLYRVRKASQATGLPESEADRILLMMRAGRGSSGRGSLKDTGEFMQVGALKDVFKEVFTQVERAGDVMERTAGMFFNVGLAAKMMNTEFEVSGTLLSEYVSGAVHKFIEDMRGLLQVINESAFITGLSKELGVVMLMLQKTIGVITLVVRGFVTGIQVIADSITWLTVQLNNLIAKIPGAGKLGLQPINTPNSKIFEGSIRAAELTNKAAQELAKNWSLTAPNRKAPNAPLMNYTLPHMGAWEKLGLSFGSGGMLDYAKETAFNTKRMADKLDAFVQKHAPQGIRPRNVLNHP